MMLFSGSSNQEMKLYTKVPHIKGKAEDTNDIQAIQEKVGHLHWKIRPIC